MLAEAIDDPATTSAAEILERYEAALAETVDDTGVDAAVEASGLDRETVAAVAAGNAGELELGDVAPILALGTDGTAESILAECRDHLLLGMSSAVLTVDRIAVDVGGDADPKEIQAKIEGRHSMTLAEYARLHHYIASAG